MMAKLNFNARGHAFKAGLDVLREGYASASAALHADVERAKSEAAAYEASDEWTGERDEDGHVLWEQGQVLGMRQEASEGALMALRKAFVLAIYHHWERAIRAYTDSGNSASHDKLVDRAREKEIPLDRRLGSVRELVNALKHNKGGTLQESWPEVLRHQARLHQQKDWYDAIQLTDAHVIEAFDVIALSGPRIWPKGKPF